MRSGAAGPANAAAPGRPADGGGVARVGSGEHRHRDVDVADGPRDRARDLEIVEDRGKPVGARHPPDGRLQPEEAGVRGGPPDRAAAVGAERQRRHAARDRRDGAAARSAGRQRRVPGVARRAEERVVGVALQGQLGDIGLAEDDGAGAAQPRHRQLVGVRNEVGVEPRAPGRAQAPDEQVVLDRHRNAVEGAQRRALRPARGARPRRRAGALRIERDDRIQHRVQPPDARLGGVERLERRERALGEERRQLRRAEIGRIHLAPPPAPAVSFSRRAGCCKLPAGRWHEPCW